MGRLAERLYFGIQRLRGGVTPSMVDRAGALLDSSWEEIRDYVERRVERNYGVRRVAGLAWLRDRRVRTKDDYRAAADAVEGSRLFGAAETRHTSGSSGRPFEFRRDRAMTGWMDAAMWAVYGWYGIEPGDRMARFWGRPLSGFDAVKRRVADGVLRQRRMSAFEVTPERSRVFFETMLDWGPKYAYGYPTLMREFVEHLRASDEDGRELDLDVVIATGEVLDASTRASLEDFFGCPVANEYGCSESGILSFECEEGSPHLIPVAAYAEVGERNPENGGVREGPVLVTDLYGDAMPFVRYALDDVARRHPASECGCGRELPRFEVVTGRRDAFIRTPEGEKIYDAVLAYSVPEGVAQFRVRQTALDRLEGRIVVAEGFDENTVVDECRAHWRNAVGSAVQVEVRAVEGIDREASGKRRYFVPLDADESKIGRPRAHPEDEGSW